MLNEPGTRPDDDDATNRGCNAQAANAGGATAQMAGPRMPTAQVPTARVVDASTACVNVAGTAEPSGLRLAITLIFGGLLRPKRAATLTRQFPLSSAFLLHVLFCGLIFAAALAFYTWCTTPRWDWLGPSDVPALIVTELGFHQYDTIREILLDGVLPLAVSACVVEVALILAALMLSAWGAAEEPLRKTWANGLRQLWLHTPMTFWLICTMALLIVLTGEDPMWTAMEFIETSWYFLSGSAAVLQDVLFHVSWSYDMLRAGDKLETLPIVVMLLVVSHCLSAWWLTAMLARIGARPIPKTSGRAARCETCGYNLTGIQVDGRCPECGRPAADMIGPQARLGTIWQQREGRNIFNAWFDTAKVAIFRPRAFGLAMRRWPGGTHHRRFFLGSLLLVVVSACVGAWILCIVTATEYALDMIVILTSGLFAMALGLAVSVALTVAAAGLVGLFLRVRTRENMTAAAMQAACYASGLWPLACLAVFLLIACVATESPLLDAIAHSSRIDPAFLGTVIFLLLTAFTFAILTLIVLRITGAMRYAHR